MILIFINIPVPCHLKTGQCAEQAINTIFAFMMDQMLNIYCSLIIYDFDCTPERVTEYLGIQPDEVRVKGMVRLSIYGGREILNKENSWEIKAKKSTGPLIDKYVMELIRTLKPCSHLLLKAKDALGRRTRMKILVGTNIDENDSYPGMYLDRRVMKCLAEHRISLDVDIC